MLKTDINDNITWTTERLCISVLNIHRL